jgi:hypothetical protein
MARTTTRSGRSAGQKRGIEEARKAREAKRMKETRLGDAIVAWEEEVQRLREALEPFRNQKGKVRTLEQNIMAMQTALYYMDAAREQAEETDDISALSVSLVDFSVAKHHGMKMDHVRECRKTLLMENVMVSATSSTANRGAGSDEYAKTMVLEHEQRKFILQFVDEQHAEGMTVTNRKLRKAIHVKLDVEITRSTLQRYMRKLGMSWKATMPKARTYKAYRQDSIGTFLIGYAKLKERMRNDGRIIPVFTDESYIHQGHGRSMSYFREGGEFNKKRGKGPRLIILHAISAQGPVCEYEEGLPIDDLIWNGNTPHPTLREDGSRTAECLWLSSSATGDYHDNMNSEMFMLWVEQRLVPSFEKQNPGRKMCLIADNAPYHHKRVVGSLSSLSKKQLIDLAREHGCWYIELPATPARLEAIAEDDEDEYGFVEENGEFFVVDISEQWDMIAKAKAKSRPFCPSKQEMQIGLVNWMKEQRPDLLECKVEAYLKSRGHEVLWTPPYCAKLQPIELFWAAGKNYAAENCWNGRNMKQTAQLLREGWYGNEHHWPDGCDSKWIGDGNMLRRKMVPASCAGMVAKAEHYMDTLFIPIAKFKGTIDALEVPDDFQPTTKDMPMDMIVCLNDEAEE